MQTSRMHAGQGEQVHKRTTRQTLGRRAALALGRSATRPLSCTAAQAHRCRYKDTYVHSRITAQAHMHCANCSTLISREILLCSVAWQSFGCCSDVAQVLTSLPTHCCILRPANNQDFISTEDQLEKFNAWCSSCSSRMELQIPVELWKSARLRQSMKAAMSAQGAAHQICPIAEYVPKSGKRPRGFKGVTSLGVRERGIGDKCLTLSEFFQGLGASSSGTQQPEQLAPAAANEHTTLEAQLQDARARVQEVEAQLHAESERSAQLHSGVGQRAVEMAVQRAALQAMQAQVAMLTAQLEGTAVEHKQVLGRELGAALEQQGRELVAVLGGQVPGGARGESVYDWMPAFIPDEDDWERCLSLTRTTGRRQRRISYVQTSRYPGRSCCSRAGRATPGAGARSCRPAPGRCCSVGAGVCVACSGAYADSSTSAFAPWSGSAFCCTACRRWLQQVTDLP